MLIGVPATPNSVNAQPSRLGVELIQMKLREALVAGCAQHVVDDPLSVS